MDNVESMFRAITFDLWNTLLDASVDRRRDRIDLLYRVCISKRCVRDRTLIESAYQEIHSRSFRSPSSNVTTDLFVQYILNAIDVNLTTRDREQVVKGFEEVILTDPPGLLDDARMILHKLHQKYKIGLVCNTGITPGRVLKQVLTYHDIVQYFTSFVFSDEAGVTKPDSAIFKKALEGLHTSAAESVHIGDLLETDIFGAKASGMAAIWINREGSADKPEANRAPDFEVKTLTSVLDIL